MPHILEALKDKESLLIVGFPILEEGAGTPGWNSFCMALFSYLEISTVSELWNTVEKFKSLNRCHLGDRLFVLVFVSSFVLLFLNCCCCCYVLASSLGSLYF